MQVVETLFTFSHSVRKVNMRMHGNLLELIRHVRKHVFPNGQWSDLRLKQCDKTHYPIIIF